ncbi:MAG TPA: glycosyltransferase [Acidimicrobiales bacterium]|nr:glycosyltransferase [Acidimicrobiales bacterium]
MSRVLFTAAPGIGHVHPMIPLALALVDAGHEVRWAVAPEACDRVRAAGFQADPAGIDQGPRLAEFRRRYPDAESTLAPTQLPDVMFPAFFGEICPPPMLADLLPIVEDWEPDLYVHDAGELAAPIAAALTGAPHVTHGFGALLPERRVAAGGEAVAGLWKAYGMEVPPYGGSYDYLYLDIYPPSMRPGPAPHVRRALDLRPVPFDAVPTDGDPALPAPSDRPLVYLTFGTVFNATGGPFANALAALAALDVDVIVTVGPRGDPGAVGPQPSNVRVERYLPQTALLPRCAAVVSHAGSGTVLACLGLGIPQLCLPQAADQFVNARQAAAVGAAMSLMPDEASPAAIVGAVTILLENPSIAHAAAEVAEEIAAMPGPDQVAADLEALL